jgi:hypothetical protein
MILPREAKPMRLPTQTQLGIKTAVANLMYRGVTNVKNQEIASIIGTTEEQAIHAWALFRSPIAPLWTTSYYTGVTASTNLWSLPFTNNAPAAEVVNWTSGVYVVDPVIVVPPPLAAVPTIVHPLLYCPASFIICFECTGFSPLGSISINYSTWTSMTDNTELGITNVVLVGGNGTATVVAANTCWVQLVAANHNASPVNPVPTGATVTVRIRNPTTAFTALLPAFSPLEQASSALLYNKSRIASSALLVSNSTAKLYQQGRLVASRIPMEGVTAWDLSAMYSTANTTNPANTWEGVGEKGVYTWTVPDERSIELTDYNYSQIATGYQLFLLSDTAYVNVIFYRGGQITASGSAGNTVQTFALEYDHVLEFTTASQLVVLRPNPLSSMDYEAAVRAISDTPPFRENPLHLAAARALIMQAMKKFYPYARPYIRAAAHGAYKYLDSLL